jgi:uncharacterized protein
MQPLARRVIVPLEQGEYLLINPYSGLADVVDSEVVQMLSSGYIDSHEEVVAALKRRGHLLGEGEEDTLNARMEMISETVHKEFSQHNLHVIMPTYQCNLRCPYCFENHIYRKGQKWQECMDEETVDALFEAILTLDEKARGEKCLVFYGGEPLQISNASIIEYILKKGDKLGYSFKIVTNGADLYHFIPLLSRVNVLKIQVTIDGPREIHDKRRFRKGKIGTFDDIVRGIDLARENGLPIGVRINVDSENLDYVPEFAEFYKEKGWYPDVYAFVTNVHASACSYSPLISAGEFTKKITELFLKDRRMDVLLQTFRYPNVLLEHLFAKKPFKPRFWACGAHTSILVYDSLGHIYPCYESVGDESHKIGSYKPTLIFNDMAQQWRTRTVFTIPECRECNLAYFCGGGCAYQAYRQKGSLNAPFCDKIKFSVKYEVPYLFHLMEEDKLLSETREWY